MTAVEAIVRALNAAGARYLIAGGLAVFAHGHLRYTAGVDLIVDLSDEDNARQALRALEDLGYRPRLPVPAGGFADPATREVWTREKGMVVISMGHPDQREAGVDLFVDPPLDFASAMSRALRLEVAPGAEATFIGLDDLLDLKRKAARALDLDDVTRLEALRRDRGEKAAMSDKPPDEDGGWEHHARDQRLRVAQLTMIQKLQWLEDAQRLVTHLQNARARALKSARSSPRDPGD